MKIEIPPERESLNLRKSDTNFPVVGVGASAGGLAAFKKFLQAIPEDSGMAYVLVQHLHPEHESALTEILQKVTTVPVLEILDAVKVETNHIYVIPSNKMLVANDGILQLIPRPANTEKRNILSIDLFFKSLAEVHQTHAVGVVLSGTASDGTTGLKAIKKHGGITFAQDEESADFKSMPHNAVQSGIVDFILPPEKIPAKLIELFKGINDNEENDLTLSQQDEQLIKQMLILVRLRKGTDFTYYKKTTINRRILRRMSIGKYESLTTYLKYLREDNQEQDLLYQDLLIPVSDFFRDPPIFDKLCENVFPAISKNKKNEPIRIWIAGCSTGQEAYSVAICIKEYLGFRAEKVQIFASDISEIAITRARRGIYTKKEVENVSPQRLQEFFTPIHGNYQINKQLRDVCIFAVHNFLKDPPFGKMDFISCRNVLIYMEPYLQKKALTTFHYALNPAGFLLLGKSESASNVNDLFTIENKTDKLFSRKEAVARFIPLGGPDDKQNRDNSMRTYVDKLKGMTEYQKTADDYVLKKYTPAGVVVNESMDIVHFRGSTSAYLEQTAGKPSHNLFKLAKKGLAFELRNILHKVRKAKMSVIKENIPMERDGRLDNISIEAVPLYNLAEPYYLILFFEKNSILDRVNSADYRRNTSGKLSRDEKDLRIQQLEDELSQVREDMRIITEDQEAAIEELQSANEELLSSSEELQSLNEEMETSKEELQSANEELIAVNQEMYTLNDQLTHARDYAEAIVGTVRAPLLILDKDLRVKSANTSYYQTFSSNEAQTEGKLIYELDNNQWRIPMLQELLEKILPEKSYLRDFELVGNFSTIGERTMLLNASRLKTKDGAEELILLGIEDVTEERKAQEEQQQNQKRLQFITDSMPQKVWTADTEGNLTYFNNVWLEYTGLSFESLKNRGWKAIVHPQDWEAYLKQWQYATQTEDNFELELRLLNKEGEYKWHLSRGLAYKGENGKILILWVGTNTEIQEHVSKKEELEKLIAQSTAELQFANDRLEEKNSQLEIKNNELESFAYVASHDLKEPLRKITTFIGRFFEKESQTLTDNGKDYFRRIESAAQRMQHLIDDILSFSRLNTPEKKFKKVDLHQILKDVEEELKEVIDEKQAIIENMALCTANVYPYQFRQLISNLLINALKFSKPDTAPHIVIKGGAKKGSELVLESPDLPKARFSASKEYCHLSISDNGIGFEPEFSERIFEIFQKLHGRSEYPGTGIGLSIVKKIVENHSGYIKASGEPGKGATFDIYLPVK